jgi:hypothetical protein
MRCPRCQGVMITVQMKELWGSDTVDGWRCLVCGENIDRVICVNRTRPAPLDQSQARVLGSFRVRYPRPSV